MITIRPGSPAASLVASILAQRQASKLSPCVRPIRGLTTELPARFRRPIVIRQAVRASAVNG
jgi:hypothetical protein